MAAAWFGVLDPAGMPLPLVTFANQAIPEALSPPHIFEQIVHADGEVPNLFSAQSKEFLERDLAL